MPELPEVETIRRSLSPRLEGRRITDVVISRPGQIRYPDAAQFAVMMMDQHFEPLQRRGKYLIMPLAPDCLRLICHLRMSGRLYLAGPEVPLAPHTHVVFHLDNGRELRYEDQRTFGGFHLVGADDIGLPPGLAGLGPEPLDSAWSAGHLAVCLRNRRAPVKALLLDQRVAAGLGNIYVDEALFQAGIHPGRPAGELTDNETVALAAAAHSVLATAIQYRGTTFSLYFDGEGAPGDFYQHLQVFDRKGEPCYTCGEPIVKTRVAGRGTHYCPRCQR